jgi:hypothetical protein
MDFIFANSNSIIANEQFLNESLEITEKILEALNVEQKYVILSIQKLLLFNLELDVKHFAKLINFFRCTVDDLMVLKDMGMFDEKVIFEEIVNRLKLKTMRAVMIELREEIFITFHNFRLSLLNKCFIYKLLNSIINYVIQTLFKALLLKNLYLITYNVFNLNFFINIIN